MNSMPDLPIPQDEIKKLFEPLVPHTTGMSFKYDYHGLYYAFRQYYVTYQYIQLLGCKKVLDFGHGIGAGSIIYDNFEWDFELEYCDIPYSWAGNEKDLFEFVHGAYGVAPPLMVTDIMSPKFEFLDEPQLVYDCVLTMRFPPISSLSITPHQFKEKLAPYCTKDFKYLYSNVSPVLGADRIWTDGPEPEFIDKRNGFLVY